MRSISIVVTLIAALVLPGAAGAATTATISTSITAPVLATITVSSGDVVCDVGRSISVASPCGSAAAITGSVRSSRNTVTSVTVTANAITNADLTNSVPASAFSMTCANASTGTQHGILTIASASSLSTSAIPCVSWAASSKGNVLLLNDTMSFTLNSYLVRADTYTVANWVVTLTAS